MADGTTDRLEPTGRAVLQPSCRGFDRPHSKRLNVGGASRCEVRHQSSCDRTEGAIPAASAVSERKALGVGRVPRLPRRQLESRLERRPSPSEESARLDLLAIPAIGDDDELVILAVDIDPAEVVFLREVPGLVVERHATAQIEAVFLAVCPGVVDVTGRIPIREGERPVERRGGDGAGRQLRRLWISRELQLGDVGDVDVTGEENYVLDFVQHDALEERGSGRREGGPGVAVLLPLRFLAEIAVLRPTPFASVDWIGREDTRAHDELGNVAPLVLFSFECEEQRVQLARFVRREARPSQQMVVGELIRRVVDISLRAGVEHEEGVPATVKRVEQVASEVPRSVQPLVRHVGVLAAVLVRLGREEEARAVIAAFREQEPDFTVATMERFAFQNRAYLERWMADLRTAGLPDE